MPQKINLQIAADWLNKQWKGDKLCPICKNNDWAISENLIELRPFQGGTIVLGGGVFPLLSVTCKVCGHTLLFNAIVAKLIDTPSPAADDLSKLDVGGDEQ